MFPRLLHLAMRLEAMLPFRRRVIGAAEGQVLEIGIGSGLNLPLYGLTVREVIGLDPSPELLLMARAPAAAAPVPSNCSKLRRSGAAGRCKRRHRGNDLDTCTIPDAPRAVAELRPVLRPGGSLLFVEHGRAPEPGVARWQDRLDPLWRRIAGGCHLNRKIDELISGSGFQNDALANARLPGPAHPYVRGRLEGR